MVHIFGTAFLKTCVSCSKHKGGGNRCEAKTMGFINGMGTGQMKGKAGKRGNCWSIHLGDTNDQTREHRTGRHSRRGLTETKQQGERQKGTLDDQTQQDETNEQGLTEVTQDNTESGATQKPRNNIDQNRVK